jgi:hypothetical protein
MATISSIRRVNESDISRAPRASRDIYIAATDASGRSIGYGRQLIARAGQPIPPRYRDHPAVKDAAAAPIDVPPAAVRVPAAPPEGDRAPAVSTMNKGDLIDELAARGVEVEKGLTVPQLRDAVKAAREGVEPDEGGDDEDAVEDDDEASDEEE